MNTARMEADQVVVGEPDAADGRAADDCLGASGSGLPHARVADP